MVENKEQSSQWQPVRLLTVKEVANWAQVHPKTVYRWIADGKLFAIILGKKTYRVPEHEVRKFLHTLGYDNLINNQEFVGGEENG